MVQMSAFWRRRKSPDGSSSITASKSSKLQVAMSFHYSKNFSFEARLTRGGGRHLLGSITESETVFKERLCVSRQKGRRIRWNKYALGHTAKRNGRHSLCYHY